jgi:hypothetical protein
MAWVMIQKAEQATWEDHERVRAALGDDPPAGVIIRAAGEVDGRWQAVSIWESKEAFETFEQEELLPAVKAAYGDDPITEGPPPSEWFEVKHMYGALSLRT